MFDISRLTRLIYNDVTAIKVILFILFVLILTYLFVICNLQAIFFLSHFSHQLSFHLGRTKISASKIACLQWRKAMNLLEMLPFLLKIKSCLYIAVCSALSGFQMQKWEDWGKLSNFINQIQEYLAYISMYLTLNPSTLLVNESSQKTIHLKEKIKAFKTWYFINGFCEQYLPNYY